MECLVQLLKSEDEAVKTLSASLVASLAHTRAGIPDGLIIAGMFALLPAVNNSTLCLVRTRPTCCFIIVQHCRMRHAGLVLSKFKLKPTTSNTIQHSAKASLTSNNIEQCWTNMCLFGFKKDMRAPIVHYTQGWEA